MFFLNFYTWFDRARRALQNHIFKKISEPLLREKYGKKMIFSYMEKVEKK